MKTNLNFLSKELSKRLVKNGFDYDIDYVYDNGESLKRLDNFTNNYNGLIPAISAEIAIQYFREVHDIDIFMARIGNVTIPKLGYSYICFVPDDDSPKYKNTVHETYESAQLEAIAMCTDFIEGIDNFDKQ